MSQENVEVVRRAFDVWNAGDVDAICGLYTEDVVVETGITGFGRTFRGHDAIARWVAEQKETWAEVHWEPERVLEADDVLVSFYLGIAVGRESGVEVVRELTGVYRVRDGKIASERIYLDREQALEAAGLAE